MDSQRSGVFSDPECFEKYIGLPEDRAAARIRQPMALDVHGAMCAHHLGIGLSAQLHWYVNSYLSNEQKLICL